MANKLILDLKLYDTNENKDESEEDNKGQQSEELDNPDTEETESQSSMSDDDADNTGGYVSASALGTDQVTWAYSWTKGNFATASSTDLTGGVIVDRANNATPASTAKLLCHFNFASPFEKTSNDTLKVFVNHTFEGAA